MKRNVSVEEISDGRFYRASDLVKIGTGGCRNCHDCCSMGPVILLVSALLTAELFDYWSIISPKN